jgi:CelD/BcsL family acetyltransferase involved in cellulose biosynthesis
MAVTEVDFTAARDLTFVAEPALRAQHAHAPWRVGFEGDLSHLESRWRSLETRQRVPTLFQSFEWCKAWVDASQKAGAQEDVRVLTISSGDRLLLLWPLAIRRLASCRILHTLGEPAAQYSEALICPEHDAEKLLELAWATFRGCKAFDAIELRRVRSDSSLSKLAVLDTYGVAGSETAAPHVNFAQLDASGAAGQRSSKSRNSLRRHERLLAEHGPITFELIDDAQSQRMAYAEAVRLKEEWTRDRAWASAGSQHPASAGCLERLADNERLCGAILRVGHKIAAVELGVKRSTAYWSLVQSYDLQFSRHAPGRLLFWKFLAECPKLGIAFFDFLAPADQHKREWANGETPVKDYLIPVSPRGRAAVIYLRSIKPRLRDCYRQLPNGLRRVAAGFVHRLS